MKLLIANLMFCKMHSLNLLHTRLIHHQRSLWEDSSCVDEILIISALFLMHRDLIEVKWLEIETAATKRHKFDGVMFSAMAQGKLATIIMEFAKSQCTSEKEAAHNNTCINSHIAVAFREFVHVGKAPSTVWSVWMFIHWRSSYCTCYAAVSSMHLL